MLASETDWMGNVNMVKGCRTEMNQNPTSRKEKGRKIKKTNHQSAPWQTEKGETNTPKRER